MVLIGHCARWFFVALSAASGAIFTRTIFYTSVQLAGIRACAGILAGFPIVIALLVAAAGPESGGDVKTRKLLLIVANCCLKTLNL